MFSNNKRKQLRMRILAAATGVAVMTFGIWLNYRDSKGEPSSEEAVQQIRIEKESVEDKVNNINEKDVKTDTENSIETYLIKERDGVVNVYIVNETGGEELYLITSIPFELLSENDQQLLQKGVRLDTKEDLGKFLESFDS